MTECRYCRPPRHACDYPGCGHHYSDDLDRIVHEAVYDDAAHLRLTEARSGRRVT
jgi:hypothetical protein